MPLIVTNRILGVALLTLSGCANDAGPPASPAAVSLSRSQAAEIRGVLADAMAAEAVPPLVLLPASGVRWSDVERAVRSAAAATEILCAIVNADLRADTGTILLRTSEGWPAVVRAHRKAGSIWFDVMVGPYPDDPAAKAQAQALNRAIVKALRVWGKKPALPS